MNKILKNPNIFIVEDHPMMIEGLRIRLEKAGYVNLVGHASTVCEAMEKIAQLQPDIVITDVSLEDGNAVQLTRALRKSMPDLKIIVFTMHDEFEYIRSFVDMGVSGYVLKNEPMEDMACAVEFACCGRFYLSPKLTLTLAHKLNAAGDADHPAAIAVLTPIELDVLKLIASGYKNHDIAENLFSAVRTIEAHRASIMKKLHIDNVAGLVKFAIRNGLTSLD